MQGGFRCKLDYLLTSLKCYIKEHKRLLLCLMLTIIGGLVLGIVITSLRENVTSRYNYIVLISNEQFNLFGTFIKVLLLTIFGMALCYLQLYHKYFYCLPYIVLFYTAYRFGGRLVGIIIADKFVGFICIITFTIPMYIAVIASLIAVTCICNFYRMSCGGKGLVCKNTNKIIIKHILCVCALLLLFLILICIIIPAIAKFIIIVWLCKSCLTFDLNKYFVIWLCINVQII